MLQFIVTVGVVLATTYAVSWVVMIVVLYNGVNKLVNEMGKARK